MLAMSVSGQDRRVLANAERITGDHFTVSTPEYRKSGEQFLVGKYVQWQKENKKAF